MTKITEKKNIEIVPSFNIILNLIQFSKPESNPYFDIILTIVQNKFILILAVCKKLMLYMAFK